MEPQEPRADVQGWLDKVRTDLASAWKLAEDDSLLDNAAYFCQQAAEKAIKAYLLLHGAEQYDLFHPCEALEKVDEDAPKKLKGKRQSGHDIGCLIQLAKIKAKEDALDSRLRDRSTLSTLESDTRYWCPGYHPVTREEYDRHYENAHGFCEYILSILPECYRIVI